MYRDGHAVTVPERSKNLSNNISLPPNPIVNRDGRAFDLETNRNISTTNTPSLPFLPSPSLSTNFISQQHNLQIDTSQHAEINNTNKRVKLTPQYDERDLSVVRPALPPLQASDASPGASRNQSRTTLGDEENVHANGVQFNPQQDAQLPNGDSKAVAKTPQYFLNIYHHLKILCNRENNTSDTSDDTGLPNVYSNAPEPASERAKEGEQEDTTLDSGVLNDLLELATEVIANEPQNTVDALPPSAFMKRSAPTLLPVIVVDDEQVTHINTVAAHLEVVVEDTTIDFHPGRLQDGHVSGVPEQSSPFQILSPGTTWESAINDTLDDVQAVQPPSEVHVDVQSLNEYPCDEQSFVPLQTQSMDVHWNSVTSLRSDQPLTASFVAPQQMNDFGRYPSHNRNYPQHVQSPEPSYQHPEPASYNNAGTTSRLERDNYNTAYNYSSIPVWSQHEQQLQISHQIEQTDPQNFIQSMYPVHSQRQQVPSAAGELTRSPPPLQPHVPHLSQATLHTPSHPSVHYTFPPSQTLNKRKREVENGTGSEQPPRKRQVLAPPSTATQEPSIPVFSLDSLPPHDPRRTRPYTELINQYRCNYPVGDDTCKTTTAIDSGDRSIKRHLSTHGAQEEQMLQDGGIAADSEKIYALYWVQKIPVTCPVHDCGYSTLVWRTDRVLDAHLEDKHPEYYAKKKQRQLEKPKKKGKKKENEKGG